MQLLVELGALGVGFALALAAARLILSGLLALTFGRSR